MQNLGSHFFYIFDWDLEKTVLDLDWKKYKQKHQQKMNETLLIEWFP